MDIPSFFEKLFVKRAQSLAWHWIPDGHVVDAQMRPVAQEPPFGVGQDYVVLRLAEMYLKTIRVLWREYYPVVHAFVAYGDPAAQRTMTTIAGPGQLKDLGTPNLDRLIGLAYRLAGPIVYDGQDLDLLAGLYAVSAKDGAKPLIDTLSQLSGIVPGLAQANTVAGILKSGVEGLLGLGDTELTLGVRDSLRLPGTGQGRPAKPGFLAAINAPQSELGAAELWIRDGRLYQGPNPPSARPFESHDMMLFELHRGPSRAAVWATLPGLAARAKAFDTILRDASEADLPKKVNDEFRAFEADLRTIDDLTQPDKAAIRAMVATDLKKRVEQIRSGNLIEFRDAAGVAHKVNPRAFSPRSLPEPPPGLTMPARADGEPLFP